MNHVHRTCRARDGALLLAAAAALLTCALASCAGCSIEAPRGGAVTVLSYNVENLFDDVADGTEYSEFVPSERGWGTELYHRKLQRIAEVLRAVSAGGADIVALEEIENERALSALNELYLKGMGYTGVVATTEGSSVNVALLSRYPLRAVRLHAVARPGEAPLRSILEAEIDCGRAALVVLVNHWKAKEGDAAGTEPLRRLSAAVAARRTAELLAERPELDIVVAGDLNESYDEYDRTGRRYPTAILPDGEALRFAERERRASLVVVDSPGELPGAGVLFDPWCLLGAGEGSTYFDGRWESIDHILLAPPLFDDQGLSFAGFEVVRRPFLLDEGGRPLRWNPRTGTGYSDHLPLLVTLRFP